LNFTKFLIKSNLNRIIEIRNDLNIFHSACSSEIV
jgi:hypothetical protein